MPDVVRGRTLVTGATGFLARHLLPATPGALALVRARSKWEAVARLPEYGDSVPIFGEVAAPEQWSAHLEGVSTIVHMAALVRHSRQGADEVYRTNVDGTLAMVRLASQLGARLVLISTSGTVGCFSAPDLQADEDAPYCADTIKRWPYYDSKMRAEIQARALADQLGVELVTVRLPVLLGPGDHVGRSTGLIARLIAGHQRFVMKGGITFADVRDVATGLTSIIATGAPRPIYHLAGTNCSLSEFFLRCADLANAEVPRILLPAPVARFMARLADDAARLVGVRSWFPDPVVVEMASHYWGFRSRWAHEIGFAARPASATLHDTITWLRTDKAVKRAA
jgi:dihydroflavonol-4-reductase